MPGIRRNSLLTAILVALVTGALAAAGALAATSAITIRIDATAQTAVGGKVIVNGDLTCLGGHRFRVAAVVVQAATGASAEGSIPLPKAHLACAGVSQRWTVSTVKAKTSPVFLVPGKAKVCVLASEQDPKVGAVALVQTCRYVALTAPK
jgi:hypothetical protein